MLNIIWRNEMKKRLMLDMKKWNEEGKDAGNEIRNEEKKLLLEKKHWNEEDNVFPKYDFDMNIKGTLPSSLE